MAILLRKKLDYEIVFNNSVYCGTYLYWKKIDVLYKKIDSLLSAIKEGTGDYTYNKTLALSLSRQVAGIVAEGLWKGDIVPKGINLAKEERKAG